MKLVRFVLLGVFFPCFIVVGGQIWKILPLKRSVVEANLPNLGQKRTSGTLGPKSPILEVSLPTFESILDTQLSNVICQHIGYICQIDEQTTTILTQIVADEFNSLFGKAELHCRGRCRFISCSRPIGVTW